jgi:hypothetical protein
MTRIDGIVEALREQRRRIDNALSALESVTRRSINGRRSKPGQGAENGRRKRRGRRLSAEARKRISQAAKARWAAAKRAGKNKL